MNAPGPADRPTALPGTDARPRVLIVDDERLNLNTLNELLKDECKVMVATNGEQGLKAVATGRPDLVLLDITMPGLGGFEVCRRLKDDPLTRGIPIIFITGLTDAAQETRGLELGAADYITKPFNLAVVRARVRTQLRLKQQSDLLERLAFFDGLTGVANRRAFDECLLREWRRHERLGKSLSMVLLDVDHFKAYNDTHGHAEGDACLRAVAAALASRVGRAGDLLARYGGEEFAVVLVDTAEVGALSVAETLRAAVHAQRLPHGGLPGVNHVTVSVGVASVIPSRGQQPENLIEAADRALYAVKQAGRNAVRSHALSGVPGAEALASPAREGTATARPRT